MHINHKSSAPHPETLGHPEPPEAPSLESESVKLQAPSLKSKSFLAEKVAVLAVD